MFKRKGKLLIPIVMTIGMMLGTSAVSFACCPAPKPGPCKPCQPTISCTADYTVNYLEQGTGKVLATQKNVKGVKVGSTVTEYAIDISGYKLVSTSPKSIVIKANNNVGMVTKWQRVTPCNRLGWSNTDSYKTVVVAKKGYRYIVWTPTALDEASKKAIYNSFSKDVNGMYGARYSDCSFFYGIDAKLDGVRVTRDCIEFDRHCTWSMFTRGAYCCQSSCSGNVINFYYEKKPAQLESYKVNYLEYGTNNKVAEPKIVTGQQVGSIVTETAPDFEGWDLYSERTQTLEIKLSKEVRKTDFATPTDNNGGWIRVTPCNKLLWKNQGAQRSVVVAKKGNSYVVWTVEPLNDAEKQAIYQSFKSHVNGMNGAKYCNVTFFSGEGSRCGGVTVTSQYIKFDCHCTWSLYAMGLYTKASEETVDLANNEITFYYTKKVAPKDVPYTVRHIDVVSGESIDDDDHGRAVVGTTITIYPKDIENYVPLEDSITWVVEDGGVVLYEYYEFKQDKPDGTP